MSTITVKHPFSDDLMDEYLLDIDWILDEFIKRKYIVTQNSTFIDWLSSSYDRRRKTAAIAAVLKVE